MRTFECIFYEIVIPALMFLNLLMYAFGAHEPSNLAAAIALGFVWNHK